MDFVRYNLLLIATSEMHHLRWPTSFWKLCNERGFAVQAGARGLRDGPEEPACTLFDKDTAKAIDSYVTIEHKIEFHLANLKARPKPRSPNSKPTARIRVTRDTASAPSSPQQKRD